MSGGRWKPGEGSVKRAFSLIELLVCCAVIALLIGLLLPAAGRARNTAQSLQCLSNVRQLGTGWNLYAHDHQDLAMPLAFFEASDIGYGDAIFWFGTDGRVSGLVDYQQGLLAPYLTSSQGEWSVYECPSQRWGSYSPQTRTSMVTTTYGYNGYYLSPSKTPGWGGQHGPIGGKRWQRISTINRPSEVMVFADTLLPVGPLGRSTALLDPPMLYDSHGAWVVNETPTTSFRHDNHTNTVHADGSGSTYSPNREAVFISRHRVGSVSATNAPAYIPDAERW